MPLAKFTSANIIIWGAILCFMSVAKGFASLMVVRFLLGFFESTIAPSLMIFTAQWYKKSEQGTRTGLWTACNALGSVFGGAVAYGLYKADREHSLSIHGWKVIYILLGTVTAFFGIIFCVMVPDTQDKAWFLNSKDKAIARDRLTENHQTVTQQPFRKAQIIEALKDPKVYLYLLISLVNNIPNGGFTNFQAILVQGLGFSTGQTLLMGMASASLGFWIIAVMFFGDKLKHRIAMAYLPLSVSCAGCAMIWGLPKEQKVARVVGFYL